MTRNIDRVLAGLLPLALIAPSGAWAGELHHLDILPDYQATLRSYVQGCEPGTADSCWQTRPVERGALRLRQEGDTLTAELQSGEWGWQVWFRLTGEFSSQNQDEPALYVDQLLTVQGPVLAPDASAYSQLGLVLRGARTEPAGPEADEGLRGYSEFTKEDLPQDVYHLVKMVRDVWLASPGALEAVAQDQLNRPQDQELVQCLNEQLLSPAPSEFNSCCDGGRDQACDRPILIGVNEQDQRPVYWYRQAIYVPPSSGLDNMTLLLFPPGTDSERAWLVLSMLETDGEGSATGPGSGAVETEGGPVVGLLIAGLVAVMGLAAFALAWRSGLLRKLQLLRPADGDGETGDTTARVQVARPWLARLAEVLRAPPHGPAPVPAQLAEIAALTGRVNEQQAKLDQLTDALREQRDRIEALENMIRALKELFFKRQEAITTTPAPAPTPAPPRPTPSVEARPTASWRSDPLWLRVSDHLRGVGAAHPLAPSQALLWAVANATTDRVLEEVDELIELARLLQAPDPSAGGAEPTPLDLRQLATASEDLTTLRQGPLALFRRLCQTGAPEDEDCGELGPEERLVLKHVFQADLDQPDLTRTRKALLERVVEPALRHEAYLLGACLVERMGDVAAGQAAALDLLGQIRRGHDPELASSQRASLVEFRDRLMATMDIRDLPIELYRTTRKAVIDMAYNAGRPSDEIYHRHVSGLTDAPRARELPREVLEGELVVRLLRPLLIDAEGQGVVAPSCIVLMPDPAAGETP